MFWENGVNHKGESARSARRVQSLIQMGSPTVSSFDGTDREVYSVGTKRSADDFYGLFGIDRRAKTITKDLCLWSTTGQMHKQLSGYMRADKKGIDYTRAVAELGIQMGPKKLGRRRGG
jgi:hypothetical protein